MGRPQRTIKRKRLDLDVDTRAVVEPVRVAPPPPPALPSTSTSTTPSPKKTLASLPSPPTSSPKKTLASSPSPPKYKISLGLKLYHRLENNDPLSDMAFGLEDGMLFPAHSLIVREGSITLEEMIKRRQSNESSPVVQLPKEVGASTFDTFLKFIYDEDSLPAPTKLKDDRLAKLLLLGDHFTIEGLVDKCCSVLKERLKADNCVQIFQIVLQVGKNDLCELAFDCILENIEHLVSIENDESMLEWSWKIWQYTLPHLSGDILVDAFKALKRWKQHDPTKRDETFLRLVKCIRFRSFGSAAAADTLESTGILSQTDMVALFMHFAGGHKTVTVHPDQDLQEILTSTPAGSRIRLSPGIYSGMFIISNHGTKLIGCGPGPKIRGRIVVDTDECEVSDLSVVAVSSTASFEEKSALTPSSGDGGLPLIFIKGDSNSVNNVQILMESVVEDTKQTDSRSRRKSKGVVPEKKKLAKSTADSHMSAILCNGNHNKIVNVISKLPTITIAGDDNRVEVVQFHSNLNGINVRGDNNTVNGIMYFPSRSPNEKSLESDQCTAVITISEGRENVVTNLNAFQVSPKSELLLLKLGKDSVSSRVRNCAGSSVQIYGKGHEVVGISLRPRFTFVVEGAGHRLLDCSAEQFKMNGKDITTDNCEFH